MQEKRQHQRRAIEAAAQIANPAGTAWHPAKLLDISESGAAFTITERAIVDTVRTFTMQLPDAPTPLRFTAKIVNRAPQGAGFRIGVCFVDIDASAVAQIRRLVAPA